MAKRKPTLFAPKPEMLVTVTDEMPNADLLRAHGITQLVNLPPEELAEVGAALLAASEQDADAEDVALYTDADADADTALDADADMPPAWHVVQIEPAPAGTVPEQPVKYWQERLVTLADDIAATQRHLDELEEEAGRLESASDLGLDGADAEIERNEVQQEAATKKLTRLRKSRGRADRGLAAARRRAEDDRQQKRRARAGELVSELDIHAREFDAALRALGRAAEAVKTDAVRLGGYSDLTNITQHAMLIASRFNGAVHCASPVLGSLLRTPRDMPLPQLRPLHEGLARAFHQFLTGEPAEPAPRALFAPAEPEAVEHVEHVEHAEPVLFIEAEQNELLPENHAPLIACEHGVLVLSEFNSGGRTYLEGESVDGATVATWRPKNVQAMLRAGRIQPLPAPSPADDGNLAV